MFGGLGLGIGFPNGPAGAPSLSAQVQAILDGTSGFVLDPTDATTMWQDSAGTTPWATSGDPVGRLVSKFGLTSKILTQSTAASRPTGNLKSIIGDGVDDFLSLASCDTIQNVGFTTIGFRAQKTANAGSTAPHFYSFDSRITNSFPNSVTNFRTNLRRLDADALTTDDSALGLLFLATDYTFVLKIDWAGTGAITLRVDKADVTSGGFPGTLGGSVGNTSNTATAFQLLASAGVNRLHGRIGRFFVAPKDLTAGELTSLEAWLEEPGAL